MLGIAVYYVMLELVGFDGEMLSLAGEGRPIIVVVLKNHSDEIFGNVPDVI